MLLNHQRRISQIRMPEISPRHIEILLYNDPELTLHITTTNNQTYPTRTIQETWLQSCDRLKNQDFADYARRNTVTSFLFRVVTFALVTNVLTVCVDAPFVIAMSVKRSNLLDRKSEA